MNKLKNIMFAVRNSSYQNLSCLEVNVVVFVWFVCWEWHVTWVVVLTANPLTYVALPTFCISEWLRSYNYVISCYFLVSFEELKETELRRGTKHLCVGKEYNVVLVVQFPKLEPLTHFIIFTSRLFTSGFHGNEET